MKRVRHLGVLALAIAAGHAIAHDEHHKVDAKTIRVEAKGHGAALGQPGDPAKVSRTIEVDMSDRMRFIPDHIEVKRGETIRFVVRNSGKVKHEMVLGTASELKAHAALMRKFPEMEHADPNQVAVESGRTGEMLWRFTQSGRFDFACLQPGHFESGMVGKVAVK